MCCNYTWNHDWLVSAFQIYLICYFNAWIDVRLFMVLDSKVIGEMSYGQLHKTEWVILISVNIDWQVGHFPSQFAAAAVWKRCQWTSIHQLRASLNQPEEWLSITASKIIVVSNLQQQPFEKQQVMEGEMPPKHCVRSAAGIFVAQALPCLALACLPLPKTVWLSEKREQATVAQKCSQVGDTKGFFWKHIFVWLAKWISGKTLVKTWKGNRKNINKKTSKIR